MYASRPLRACVSAIGLACLAAALSAQSATTGSVQWYRSDPDMIRRDPIAVGRAVDDSETPPEGVSWALAVERGESRGDRLVENARLYHNGVYRGYERTEMTRGGARPVQRERYGADDELLYREEFRYRRDGSLRETLRTDADGETVLLLYGLPEDSWDEYVYAPEYTLLRRFDDRGRPEYTRREAHDGAADPADADGPADSPAADSVREEWFSYRDGRLAERRVQQGPRNELYRYRDGAVVLEEIRTANRLLRSVERTFDAEGRINEEITREAGSVRREIWRRETDDSYEMERIVDGHMVFHERATADGDRIVTRYRDGQPVVREFFSDGVRYRRQIFADGEIVRVEER